MADEFEKYAAQDETDEFSQFADKEPAPVGDTTPYPIPKHPLMTRGGVFTDIGANGPEARDITPDNMKAAAASGVNVTTSRPSVESFKAGFAANPVEKEAFITSAIASRYGEDVHTRTGPDTGKFEFYNPESGRWELAEPNAMEMLPGLLETVPSMAGSVAGGVAGSPAGPAGTAFGAAGGAGLGQAAGHYAKSQIGKAFGLNQSIDNFDLLKQSAGSGIEVAAWDLGGSALYAGVRGIKAVIMGKQYLKPEQAAELLAAQRRSDQLIAEVEKESGVKFQPFTGQIGAGTRAGDKVLGEGMNLVNDPTHAFEMSQQIKGNENALAAYFDNTLLDKRMNLDAPHEGAVPLKQAVAAEGQAKDSMTAGLANAQDQAAAKLQSIGRVDPTKAGAGVREQISAKYQVAKKAKNDAYAEYQASAGYNGKGTSNIEIPLTDEILQSQKDLKKQIKRLPLKSSAQGKKALLLKKGATMNLSDIDTMLKDLRYDLRKAKQGKLSLPFNELDAKKLEGQLTAMRNDYLAANHPEAYEKLVSAEHAAYNESTLFKRGLAKSLLVKENGEYKLSDAKVLTAIMKRRDVSAAQEISEIMGADPNAKVQAQNYLMALYRKSVTKDAAGTVPVYAKHKKFMDEYGPVMDAFFDESQRTKIRELGGLAETIATNQTNLKALNAIWNKSYKGEIDRLSAEALVDRVFTKSFSNEKIRDIASIAGRYSPEVLKSWRAGVADKLRERIFKDGLIDGQGLTKIVDDLDTKMKLRTIFGPGYIKNLETLKKAVDLSRHLPESINLPNKATFFTDVARATYGAPLTREGRLVSMFQNTRSRALANKIWRALSDPDELAKLASRTERTIKMIQGINLTTTATQELQSD